MSFPRYQKYKESGVEWLGQLPSHWEVKLLKRLAKLTTGITPPTEDPANYLDEGSYGWVRPDDLDALGQPTRASKFLSSKGWTLVRPVDAGASLVCCIGTIGKIGYSATRLSTNQQITAVSVVRNPRYFYFVLTAGRHQMEVASTGNVLRILNTERLGAIPCPCPPAEEALAIASFLDHETAKIDALVAEQEHLIELLKEKRQAVISHAVTKGLNPDVSMKDSGIEGLGQVPQHWDVRKMKSVAEMESGHTPDKKVPAYWDGGQIPWVSLNDTGYLKDHDLITDTAFQITDAGIANSSAHLLPAQAVVFSRDATIGRCAITTRPMAVSQHFIAWLCGPSLLPEFLLLRLRSMTQELDRLTTGATIKTIGMPEVRTLMTPVPPLKEQEAIVGHCKLQCAALDGFIVEAERAVALLLERRTALISAAVTGQIDVRPESMRTAA